MSSPVTKVSRLFGYTRQNFYKRLKEQELSVDKSDQVLMHVLRERARMPRLGGRKLKYRMALEGLYYGRDRLFDLLRRNHLLIKPLRSYTKTTYSKHWLKKYGNLIKQKQVDLPNQVWVSDITYIKTDEGYKYLSLVTDKFSRKIVGYDLSDSLKADGAIRALQMAISQRDHQHELIHHSDRGLQYCSHEYQQLLVEHQIIPSMTEQYDPYENALAERMNGILKAEFLLEDGFPNSQLAKQAIEESIETYNTIRPHTSLNMRTPQQAHISKDPKALESFRVFEIKN
jgi:transposase InsO family protein